MAGVGNDPPTDDEELERVVHIDAAPTPAPTDGNAVEEAVPRKMRTKYQQGYLFAWNLMYDLFTVAVGLVDIISDVIVTYQFYYISQTFFALSLSAMLLAQLCYTILFLSLFQKYTWEMSSLARALQTIFVLCFAQFVPLFIWLHSFRFGVVDRALQACGFRHDTNKQHFNEFNDPFKTYLERKFQTHGGFIVESFVESIPQSIIQMVAITMTKQYSAINVFSIVMSLISICTKALMASYSLKKFVVTFNFLCIVHDVFCLFCTVCWLFLPSPAESYPVFYAPLNNSIFSAIWFYKEIAVILGIMIPAFIIALFLWIKEIRREGRQPFIIGILGFLLSCLAAVPVFFILEGFKLSIFPTKITQEQDASGEGHHLLHPMYKWMSDKYWKVRLRVANVFFYSGMVSISLYDTTYVDALTPATGYSHQMIRTKKGFTTDYMWDTIKSLFKELTHARLNNWMDKAVALLAFYVYFLLGPAIVLSWLYSIFYPLICFFWYLSMGYPVPLLHLTLTTMHCCILLVLILLIWPVWQYKRLHLYSIVSTFDITMFANEINMRLSQDSTWLKAIQEKSAEIEESGKPVDHEALVRWGLQYHFKDRLEKARTPAYFYQGAGVKFIENDEQRWWDLAGMQMPADYLRPDDVYENGYRPYYYARRRHRDYHMEQQWRQAAPQPPAVPIVPGAALAAAAPQQPVAAGEGGDASDEGAEPKAGPAPKEGDSSGAMKSVTAAATEPGTEQRPAPQRPTSVELARGATTLKSATSTSRRSSGQNSPRASRRASTAIDVDTTIEDEDAGEVTPMIGKDKGKEKGNDFDDESSGDLISNDLGVSSITSSDEAVPTPGAGAKGTGAN